MGARIRMRGVVVVAALGATFAVESAAHAADDEQGAAVASWTTSQKPGPRTRPRTGLVIAGAAVLGVSQIIPVAVAAKHDFAGTF